MTDDLIPTMEGFSSARIDSLLLSRKLWESCDEFKEYLHASDDENPIFRDMQSLYEDADHILKLLKNMDERFQYIRQNHQRQMLLSEHSEELE